MPVEKRQKADRDESSPNIFNSPQPSNEFIRNVK